MSLLQMSVAGAVMIVSITVIRALAINRLPKKTFLVLWGIALVRLLIPFSLPSVFSVYSLLRRTAPVMDTVNDTPAAHLLPMVPAGQMIANPSADTAATISVWFLLWAIGALVCALFFAVSYWRCCKEFQTSLPVDNDFTRHWLSAHRLKRPFSIRQSGLISTPLTFGVFHPVILMPKTTDWNNETALQYVLTHEYVHIRRFDTLTKLAFMLALCVHWFNPLVWVMYALVNRDIELSCDETVIRLFGEHTKSAYARTLISMEETRSGLTPLCNHFCSNAMKERITAIMKSKQTTALSFILAALLVAGTVTAFATSAQTDSSQDHLSSQDESTDDVVITVSEYEGTDGTIYYALDENAMHETDADGKTHYTVTEGVLECRIYGGYEEHIASDIEWWTYEEYQEWLELEKEQLQSMLGEKAWTGGGGEFTWTQELIDETIASYEQTLQDIKDGMMYSKPIDVDSGEGGIMVAYDPEYISTTQSYQLIVKLNNGDEKRFGPYESAEELLAVVRPFCQEQVQLGNMEQSEADEIIATYENETCENEQPFDYS